MQRKRGNFHPASQPQNPPLFLRFLRVSGFLVLLLFSEKKMRVTLGSDHAGFELKQALIAHLQQNGHTVVDVGTCNTDPVDYPDFAEAVGLSVLRGESERGILICGSGVGASVAANKVPGVRAG